MLKTLCSKQYGALAFSVAFVALVSPTSIHRGAFMRHSLFGIPFCSVLVSVLFCFSCAALAQDAPDTEGEAVKQRYALLLREYRTLQNGPKAPAALAFALKNNMLSATLGNLIKRDEAAAAKRGEVGKLDFDFLLNAQDVPEKLDVTKCERKGDVLHLSVETGEVGQGFVLALIKEKDRWVMDDALYPADKGSAVSLKSLLK
jgi:hypothetical protein